ncbi:MAG: hypothetical protein WAS73_01580 [Defluviicoccus sp.]
MKLKSVRCLATAAEPPLMSAEEMISASEMSRQPLEGRIEAIIGTAGDAGVTKTEVIRRTQFVDRRRRNNALAALIEAGRIVAVKQPTATRPAIVLRLAGNCESAADPEAMVPSPVNGSPIEALAGGRPTPPVILALDLGQRTGWAVRSRDGAIASGVQEFRPGRFEGGGMIWLRFRAWLQEIDETSGGVGVVVFEEVRRHLGTAAAHAFGGYLAHLTAWAEANRIPYQGVPVGTIKRHIAGKGNADKAAVIAAVKALGFAPTDDNEADALALLDWAIAHGIGGVR